MNQRTFVERRSPSWQRLDALLRRIQRRGAHGLAPDEIFELSRLYRAMTSDLAYAQGRGFDGALLEYLNRSVARAHAQVYARAPESGLARIGEFYARTFPHEVRRSLPYIALCAAITVACATVAYVLVRNHPADAYAFLPKFMVSEHIRKSLHDSNFAVDPSFAPAMSAAIIANNVRVAIVAFAGCVTLGALTLYIIATNGLMLGGMGALFTNAGFGSDFWATIAPHGVIELTAIQIAGGAGLLIAAGVVFPGRLRRRDAILANARRAGTLIVGVASMLIVAGTIEAFVSPRRLPESVRILVGVLTLSALVLYFASAVRQAQDRPVSGKLQ
ncbi:MAG: stage II sporulation protein M [Candidatus Eremiobacteraeota bacterium]|nr:stage II sporulation protein M [Candidatus Eremiobacteraeota bacterium]